MEDPIDAFRNYYVPLMAEHPKLAAGRVLAALACVNVAFATSVREARGCVRSVLRANKEETAAAWANNGPRNRFKYSHWMLQRVFVEHERGSGKYVYWWTGSQFPYDAHGTTSFKDIGNFAHQIENNAEENVIKIIMACECKLRSLSTCTLSASDIIADVVNALYPIIPDVQIDFGRGYDLSIIKFALTASDSAGVVALSGHACSRAVEAVRTASMSCVQKLVLSATNEKTNLVLADKTLPRLKELVLNDKPLGVGKLVNRPGLRSLSLESGRNLCYVLQILGHPLLGEQRLSNLEELTIHMCDEWGEMDECGTCKRLPNLLRLIQDAAPSLEMLVLDIPGDKTLVSFCAGVSLPKLKTLGIRSADVDAFLLSADKLKTLHSLGLQTITLTYTPNMKRSACTQLRDALSHLTNGLEIQNLYDEDTDEDDEDEGEDEADAALNKIRCLWERAAM